MTAEERILFKLRKALDKSKYRDSLRAVERYIPRLEQDLELLRLQAENKTATPDKNQEIGFENFSPEHRSDQQIEASDELKRIMVENEEQCEENDSMVDTDLCSDSEDLSDIFETDSDQEHEEKAEEPLYWMCLKSFQRKAMEMNRILRSICVKYLPNR